MTNFFENEARSMAALYIGMPVLSWLAGLLAVLWVSARSAAHDRPCIPSSETAVIQNPGSLDGGP